MLPKKYYDGFIIHDILSKHLDGKKFLEVIKEFAAAKGVDVEPVRHGKWLIYCETKDGRSMRCSVCSMVFWVGNGRDGNYCPNCGAKMDEERKE